MSKWCQFSKIRRTVCLALKVKCKLGNENKNTNQFSESCNSFTSATLRMRNVPTCAYESNSYERREKKHKKKSRQHKYVLSVQPQWQVWPAAMTSCAQTTCEGGKQKSVDGLRDSFSLQPSWQTVRQSAGMPVCPPAWPHSWLRQHWRLWQSVVLRCRPLPWFRLGQRRSWHI